MADAKRRKEVCGGVMPPVSLPPGDTMGSEDILLTYLLAGIGALCEPGDIECVNALIQGGPVPSRRAAASRNLASIKVRGRAALALPSAAPGSLPPGTLVDQRLFMIPRLQGDRPNYGRLLSFVVHSDEPERDSLYRQCIETSKHRCSVVHEAPASQTRRDADDEGKKKRSKDRRRVNAVRNELKRLEAGGQISKTSEKVTIGIGYCDAAAKYPQLCAQQSFLRL
eukprot:TRINITY_DN9236_c0_g2_i1.p1 TRINITY_DN9236_c0_g2~~TRINITY_DN9236_c0_g2_i1.p1  ORF type:complete len:246 (+),score=7.49 TRINITY_DN9236_c0_g2_i1:66-740(+)